MAAMTNPVNPMTDMFEINGGSRDTTSSDEPTSSAAIMSAIAWIALALSALALYPVTAQPASSGSFSLVGSMSQFRRGPHRHVVD